MGNVMSRCTHGISLALQKCRLQKKNSEVETLKERKSRVEGCDQIKTHKEEEIQTVPKSGQQVVEVPVTSAEAFENISEGKKCSDIQCRNTNGSPGVCFQHSNLLLDQLAGEESLVAEDTLPVVKNSAENTSRQVYFSSGEVKTSANQRDEEGHDSEQIKVLVQRQEKVLHDLQALQRTVQTLAQKQGVDLTELTESSPVPFRSSSLVTTSVSEISPLQEGKFQEVVVNADPANVPLSLLVLLKQLSAQYRILTNTFVHSSAINTPENLRRFLSNGIQQGSRSDYQLSVSIIWKKDPDGPRLMVNPTRQTSIKGEANIARYLARLLQPAYDAGDISNATQIDELLDLAQLQVIYGNNKERAAALRTLNARLGKAQWLVDSQPTVADVVLWSALQSTHLAADAPANVKKWLKGCAELALFQEAIQFMSS